MQIVRMFKNIMLSKTGLTLLTFLCMNHVYEVPEQARVYHINKIRAVVAPEDWMMRTVKYHERNFCGHYHAR